MHILGNFYCQQAVGESGMLNLVQIMFADIPDELYVEELSPCQGWPNFAPQGSEQGNCLVIRT